MKKPATPDDELGQLMESLDQASELWELKQATFRLAEFVGKHRHEYVQETLEVKGVTATIRHEFVTKRTGEAL